MSQAVSLVELDQPRLGRLRREMLPWLTWGAVLLCVAGMYGKTFTYYGTFLRGWDGQSYYAQARSLVVDGDLHTEPELLEMTPNAAVFYRDGAHYLPLDRAGRVVNKYTIGWALLALPALGAAHAFELAIGWPATGYSTLDEVAATLSMAVYGLFGLWCAYLAARRLVGETSACVATLAILLGTNALYYLSVYPVMNHAPSLGAMGVLLYAAVRMWDTEPGHAPRWWAVAGFASAVLVVLRPTDAVMMVVLWPAMWRWWQQVGARSLPWLALPVVGVAVGFGLQLIAWRMMFGYWVLNAYDEIGESTFYWLKPAFPDILVSFQRGGWYYHPIFGIGTLALAWIAWAARDRRWLAASLLLAAALHAYVYASFWTWDFGVSFGNRIFVNLAPVALIGLALARARLSGASRYTLDSVLVALVAWNLLLMTGYITGTLGNSAAPPSAMIDSQWAVVRAAMGW